MSGKAGEGMVNIGTTIDIEIDESVVARGKASNYTKTAYYREIIREWHRLGMPSISELDEKISGIPRTKGQQD